MTGAMFTTEGGRREFGRIYPPRTEWLAKQAVEPVLEPDLPIVDTHFHFIDLPGFRYLAEELSADLSSGHRIVGTVYAEAQTHYRSDVELPLRPVGETSFVVHETQGRPKTANGIVGYADLMLGAAVEAPLLAHIEAGKGRFKGIRYSLAFDPSPEIIVHHQPPADIFSQAAFHEGLRTLSRLGLSLDAWAFFHQQRDIAALARAHPDLNVICCHCGGLLGYGPYAGKSEEVFATWRSNMAVLAELPNVSMKIGGILGRLAAYDYLNTPVPETSQALSDCLRRYVMTLIELFGPERCMFESNYPVDTVVTGYRVLWNTFKRITADFTPGEKANLYSETATRVYRLER